MAAAAGHVHAVHVQCRCRCSERAGAAPVQVLLRGPRMAHQDRLEPKKQQQDGEAEHEGAFGLSALELRPEHDAVGELRAGWAVVA